MVEQVEDGLVRVLVKAVPGATRDEVVGPLGDRLKIRVAAPPEGGRANRAICRLLAASLGVPVRDVEIASGTCRAEKSLLVRGVEADEVRRKLALGG